MYLVLMDDDHPRHPTRDTRSRRARGRPMALATLAVALTLVLAACGGGSAKPAAAPATTTQAPVGAGGRASTRAAIAAFRACLQQHGVTLRSVPTTAPGQTPVTGAEGGAGGRRFPGGGVGALGGVLTNPADQAAVQACQSTLPAGSLSQLQQRGNQVTAFRSCMKDHGVVVTGGFGPGSTTTTTPAYAAAFAVCRAILPSGGNFGRGGGATSTTAGA